MTSEDNTALAKPGRRRRRIIKATLLLTIVAGLAFPPAGLLLLPAALGIVWYSYPSMRRQIILGALLLPVAAFVIFLLFALVYVSFFLRL